MSFFRSGGLLVLRYQSAALVGGLPTVAVGSEGVSIRPPKHSLDWLAMLLIVPRPNRGPHVVSLRKANIYPPLGSPGPATSTNERPRFDPAENPIEVEGTPLPRGQARL